MAALSVTVEWRLYTATHRATQTSGWFWFKHRKKPVVNLNYRKGVGSLLLWCWFCTLFTYMISQVWSRTWNKIDKAWLGNSEILKSRHLKAAKLRNFYNKNGLILHCTYWIDVQNKLLYTGFPTVTSARSRNCVLQRFFQNPAFTFGPIWIRLLKWPLPKKIRLPHNDLLYGHHDLWP